MNLLQKAIAKVPFILGNPSSLVYIQQMCHFQRQAEPNNASKNKC